MVMFILYYLYSNINHERFDRKLYRRSRIFYHRYSVSAKPRKRKAGSFSDPAGTQQAGRRTFFQRSVRSTATETGALFWKYSPALLWKAQEVFPADP